MLLKAELKSINRILAYLFGDKMEGEGNSVIDRAVLSVSELWWIKPVIADRLQVPQYQAFKHFHHHRSKRHRSVVVHGCHLRLLWNWDNDGRFETVGDFGELKGDVKNISKNSRKLVSTVLQHGSRDVWARGFPAVLLPEELQTLQR